MSATPILPAWFTERMMRDAWCFGLLMITGDLIAIEQITAVVQDASGNIWLDATLIEPKFSPGSVSGYKVLTSPTSRTSVSINAAHVVAAFEFADT